MKVIKRIAIFGVLAFSVDAELLHRYTFETIEGSFQVVDDIGSLHAVGLQNAAVTTNLYPNPHYRVEGAGALYMNKFKSFVRFEKWDAGDNFTMTWWIYPQSCIEASNGGNQIAMPLLANTSFGAQNGILVYVHNHWAPDHAADGRITVSTGSGPQSAQNIAQFVDNVITTTNTYFHVALVVRGDDQRFDLYVNGEGVSTNRWLHQTFSMNPDAAWMIGAQFDGNHSAFNGFLDDIQIYNTALSAEEISTLHLNPGYAFGRR